MGVETRASLTTENAANIADNNANDISPKDVRDLIQNIIDSHLNPSDDPHVEKASQILGIAGSVIFAFIDSTGTNHWGVTIPAGEGTPLLEARGSGTNISGEIKSKGTGDLKFFVNAIQTLTLFGNGDGADILGNLTWGGTDKRIRSKSNELNTTNATVTTILTIALGTDASYTMTVNVMAHDDAEDQRLSLVEHLAINVKAGTVSIGNQATALTYNPSTSVGGVTFNVGTANTLLVKVEGLGGVNLHWRAYVSDIGGDF